MKFRMLPQAVGVVKLMVDLFWVISIQRRELWLGHVIRFDSYEPVSFKHSMMLSTTMFYIFDTSLNDLDGHSRSQAYEVELM